jgi:hypothetical protein
LRDDRDRREVTYAKNLAQLAGKLIRGITDKSRAADEAK